MLGPNYLSVSQVKTLKTCHRQYLFKYVLKERESRNKNLLVGSAFHKMLEGKDGEMEMSELSKDPYPHRGVLMKMKRAYDEATKDIPKAHAREVSFKLTTPSYDVLGYADAVRTEEDGWYIGEDKTAAQVDENKKNMLAYDLQLCTYAYSHAEIARMANVDKPFKGFIYTITTKPSERLKKTESPEEYLARASVETRVWKLEAPSQESIKLIVETEFGWAQKQKEEIERVWMGTQSIDAIPSNSGACFNFNTPCAFFEKCYGVKPVSKYETA